MRPLCAYRLCWTRTDQATPFAFQHFPSRCVISLSQSYHTFTLASLEFLFESRLLVDNVKGWARNTYPSPTRSPSITQHYPCVCYKMVATFLDRFTTHLLSLYVASRYWFILLSYMACTVCLSRLVCTSPLCYFNTWFGQGGYIIGMDRRVRFMAFMALNADVTGEDEILRHD